MYQLCFSYFSIVLKILVSCFLTVLFTGERYIPDHFLYCKIKVRLGADNRSRNGNHLEMARLWSRVCRVVHACWLWRGGSYGNRPRRHLVGARMIQTILKWTLVGASVYGVVWLAHVIMVSAGFGVYFWALAVFMFSVWIKAIN